MTFSSSPVRASRASRSKIPPQVVYPGPGGIQKRADLMRLQLGCHVEAPFNKRSVLEQRISEMRYIQWFFGLRKTER